MRACVCGVCACVVECVHEFTIESSGFVSD